MYKSLTTSIWIAHMEEKAANAFKSFDMTCKYNPIE